VKTDSLRTLDSLLRQTVTILPINEKEVESEQEGRRKGKKRDVKKSDVDLILLFRARNPIVLRNCHCMPTLAPYQLLCAKSLAEKTV
jgi:hypothetical protein